MRVRSTGQNRGESLESARTHRSGRLTWSAVLSACTLGAVLALSVLDSGVGASLTEAVQAPGVWLASAAFPQGIHGSHPRSYLVFAILANVAVYFALWFATLTIVSSVRGRPAK